MLARVLCICLLTAGLQLLPQAVQGGYITNHFFSSCTGGSTVLPNLAMGKSVTTGAVSWNCNGAATNTFAWSQVITWFYYPTYPPTWGTNPVDMCCHTTATSTLTFYLTAFTDTLVGTIVTSTGNVTSGAFLGSVVTLTGTKLNTNAAQCGSPMGVEARSGTRTLTIIGGPTCTGVVTEELCPGVRFG